MLIDNIHKPLKELNKISLFHSLKYNAQSRLEAEDTLRII